MAQHTPGPWKIGRGHPADIDANDGKLAIASAWDSQARHVQKDRQLDAPEEAECIANARLISAAPDLLAALKSAREQLELSEAVISGERFNDTQINAAIAKAEGN